MGKFTKPDSPLLLVEDIGKLKILLSSLAPTGIWGEKTLSSVISVEGLGQVSNEDFVVGVISGDGGNLKNSSCPPDQVF